MNNQECKVRPQIVNFNSDEPLEECKYKIKKIKMSKFINTELESVKVRSRVYTLSLQFVLSQIYTFIKNFNT